MGVRVLCTPNTPNVNTQRNNHDATRKAHTNEQTQQQQTTTQKHHNTPTKNSRYEDLLNEGNLDMDTPHEEMAAPPPGATGPWADAMREAARCA